MLWELIRWPIPVPSNQGERPWPFLEQALIKPTLTQNKVLFGLIQEKGALLSEYSVGVGPERGHFPRRNRLISALCCGVIVIQCHHQSGALNTAAHARRLGIPLFALPGRPGEPLAAGPHRLIREGAQLIESGEEILSRLEASWRSVGTQLPLWESPQSENTNDSSPSPSFPPQAGEKAKDGGEAAWRVGGAQGALDPEEAFGEERNWQEAREQLSNEELQLLRFLTTQPATCGSFDSKMWRTDLACVISSASDGVGGLGGFVSGDGLVSHPSPRSTVRSYVTTDVSNEEKKEKRSSVLLVGVWRFLNA